MLADVVILIAGLSIMVLGVLSGLEKLPRNAGVGIRIASVMESDEAWRLGHRAAARWTFGGGFFAAAAAIVSLSIGTESAVLTLIGTVGLVVLLLIGTRVASTAAQALNERR